MAQTEVKIPIQTALYKMPVNYEHSLTEDERSMLTHCLRVAAQDFERNARTIADAPLQPSLTFGAKHFLTQQFERQAAQAKELADRIDNAAHVKLGPEEEAEVEPEEPSKG